MYEYVFYLHRTCQACCFLHVYQVTHYCEPSCSKQAMQERSCKQRVACATMLSQVVVHAAGITQTHVCAGTARHWQSQVFFLVILCLILLSSSLTDLCGAVYPMGGR